MSCWAFHPNVYGLAIAAQMFPGRIVLLCGDNRGAKQALSRGSCKTELGKMLRSVFWTVAASFATPVWIESVAGTLNPSDVPSRDCIICEKPIVCKSKRCEVPIFLKRLLASRSCVHLAQFSIHMGNLGFGNSWTCPNKENRV